MKREITSALCAMVLIFCADVALPAWSTDPAVNTPVCTAPYYQSGPQIISDGSSGAIIVWEDQRSGGTFAGDIYAQRIDSSGNALWTANGVPVSTSPGSQQTPRLIPDSSGGAIILWTEYGNGTKFEIYAQRLDSSGNFLWKGDGVLVYATSFTPGRDQGGLQIIPDGSGGTFLTWHDFKHWITAEDIYAQRLDSSGNVLWGPYGVTVCAAPWMQTWPHLISDDSGGAIITWSDFRKGTDFDIYAQRLDSSGYALWSPDGVPVCTDPYDQYYGKQIVSDGSGGAIITWDDWRDEPYEYTNIYAQRLDASGNALWLINGVPVSVARYYQASPQLISDGSGGAIITWYDSRNEPSELGLGLQGDIYAQRLDSSGNSLWTEDGMPVCATFGAQMENQITSDGSGGAIITWKDGRSGTNNDIYVQRLNSSGIPFWLANGVPVCTASGNQISPSLVHEGSGGAIITWTDIRIPECDIYAQLVNYLGKLGPLPPSPPSPTGRASLIIPWYNDSGGSNRMASFLSVFNPTSYNITLTVTYKAPSSVDATPKANTFVLGPGEAKIGRPFQVSGAGEALESGPPYSMPNAIASAPFGSATFTAQVPAGSKIYGDVLRMGAIDLDGDGTLEPFSGIGPAVSK